MNVLILNSFLNSLTFRSFRVNVELQETHTANKNVSRLENGEEKELISNSGGYQPSTDEVRKYLAGKNMWSWRFSIHDFSL